MGTISSQPHGNQTTERTVPAASWPDAAGSRAALVTGTLFIASTVAFMVAATVLSRTFDWPDILREQADVVLPKFAAGGASLVWTWFAVAWTYAVLAVPILLLPTALARRGDAALRVATYLGAASVLLSLIGFLRWVFVVPALADSYVRGDATTRSAVAAAWTAQHSYLWAIWLIVLGVLLLRRVNGGVR
jgi:uncharacterized protein DUF4386